MSFLSNSSLAVLALGVVASYGCSNSGGEDGNSPEAAAKVSAEAESPTAAPEPVRQTHANGMERFKDPGVYVDGKPLGVLRFGELPVPLEPVWFEERAAVPFKKGDSGPRYKIIEQRRYRFRDYFAAMGVDVAKIKELHLYGGNQRAAAIVIPGKSIREMDDFLFRFGGNIWGKPLPACPANVGDGKCPDQIGALALYVEKEPPERDGGYFYFKGDKETIKGIPYFGEPIRGGVRVYMDGPLAATVKRNRLRAKEIRPVAVEGDKETYRLIDFLKAEGVETDKVQELWMVRYERRVEKLSREQLLEGTFTTKKGGSGEILVGPNNTETHAIALHSRELSLDDLPKLRTDELEKADG